MAIRVDKIYKKELKKAKSKSFSNAEEVSKPKKKGIVEIVKKNKGLTILAIMLIIGVAFHFIAKKRKKAKQLNDLQIPNSE